MASAYCPQQIGMTEDDWPKTADGIESLLNRVAQLEDLTI